jgi:hypothetical protein
MTIIAMQHQGFFLGLTSDGGQRFFLSGLAAGTPYGFVKEFDNFEKAYEEWIGVSELLVEGECFA